MAGKKETIKATGKKPITFQRGGLHESLGVAADKPIPPKKMAAAARGEYGSKAEKQANFAKNVLATGRKTAAKGRSSGKTTPKGK
jgi:hypothetical protein